MPIVSSRIIINSLNRTGQFRYFGLIFTDHLGFEHKRGGLYIAPNTDVPALIAELVIKTENQLKRQDLIRAVYSRSWDYTLKYATLTELRDYVRAEYRNNRKKGLLPLARRIIEWIENGRFTATQFRNAFGMTASQFNSFRSRLIALRDSDDLIEAAEGE